MRDDHRLGPLTVTKAYAVTCRNERCLCNGDLCRIATGAFAGSLALVLEVRDAVHLGSMGDDFLIAVCELYDSRVSHRGIEWAANSMRTSAGIKGIVFSSSELEVLSHA